MLKETPKDLIAIIQTILLTIVMPFIVYYVQNYAPYVKDKPVLELRLDHQQKQLDKLTEIVERLERKVK